MGKRNIITKKQVSHVAILSNLDISVNELEIYTKQLQEVLSYMDILNNLNTDGVKPTYQTIDKTSNIFRQDIIKNCLKQKHALSQSINSYKGYFVSSHVFDKKEKIKNSKKKIEKREKLDEYNSILTIVDDSGKVGHKDLFMTSGVETTAGSNILNRYVAHYSSRVVDLLENSGHKAKYKLNLDAWGHGASGENSDFGPTLNPWDIKRVPGGSSSGSGVAVAIDDVKIATGTDTCGSIRMPSSYNNVCGIKPTYGALSRYGVIAFASSLDCPGLMGKTVKILRNYFSIVSKEDKNDATSRSAERKKYLKQKVRKIGIPKEFFQKGIDKEVKYVFYKAVEDYKKLGYVFKDVSLPHSVYGVAAYYIIAPTETSSNLARYDGIRYGNQRTHFGSEAKRRIMLGTFSSSEGYSKRYYEKAARVRTLIIKDFEKVFSDVDCILAPVSPIPPFLIGEKTSDPLEMYLMDIYTAPASLSGCPSLALPCGFSKNKLPIGMQIIGPRWSEYSLFDVGEKYQSITEWHDMKPKKQK